MNTQPGQLDEQITLSSPSTAQDSYGQAIVSWSSQGAFWADVQEGHGSETVKGAERVEDQPLTVIIRGGSGVATGWKVTRGSDTYRITSVRRVGRNHWTEIKAVRIGDSESGE